MTRQSSHLLLVNGVILGTVGLLQFGLDFAAYFTGFGPTGPALHNNLDALGYAEAHGLAAVLGFLWVTRRQDGYLGWHAIAASTHLLLGACNLIYWPLFAKWGLVPMGVAATLMHAVFFVLETRAFFSAKRAQPLRA